MCGRFSQSESPERLARLFGAEPDADLPDGSYNVAPTDPVRIVVERDDTRRLAAARWGFRPFWAGDAVRPSAWINARLETAAASPAFGPALRARRCLIPADAFYEWDRSGGGRQPYAIGASETDALLALAGIWSPPAVDALPPTVAILTTAPNELLARVHNRMPVIVPEPQWSAWLRPSPSTDADLLTDLVVPIDPAALRMWPVASDVNRVTNDGPHLLDPVPSSPSSPSSPSLGLV